MSVLVALIAGLAVGAAVGAVVARRVRQGARKESTSPSEQADRPQPRAPGGRTDPGLDSVLRDHSIGVVVADETGHVVYRNAAVADHDHRHTGPLLAGAVERHLAAAAAGQAARESLEFLGPPPTAYDIIARPLDGGGSVVFVEDVSERRQLERMRTDFVANVSHELKTPVGAMSLLAETLSEERDPETIARLTARLVIEAERATRTIEDLLELSRIESPHGVQTAPTGVLDVVHEAVDRVAELSARRGITVDVTAGSGADCVVSADRRYVTAAITNLVHNAVSYSPSGSTVDVVVASDDGWVDVAVTDRGIGIPRRDLDRVFERFYRVDRARTRSTGGTGLGLAIVRSVASRHGGSVSVTSTEGEGSTFVLRLPVEAPA